MNICKFLFCITAAICLFACSGNLANKQIKYTPSATVIPPNAALNLKLPKAANVPFRGEVCFDDAGQKAGEFLYPAPNAAGFLAAIATHAAISNSINDSQKNSFQEKADEVLNPYKTVINSFSYQELADSSLKKLDAQKNGFAISYADVSDQAWILESSPVFVLSQNKDSLILQNSIVVYAAGSPSSIIYRNMIEVISSPINTADFERYWNDNSGANLKSTSAELFAGAIRIAFDEIKKENNTDENAYKTFHYQEGKSEKLERGQLIGAACDRIVIRTLRGWIMSVPSKDGSACHNAI